MFESSPTRHATIAQRQSTGADDLGCVGSTPARCDGAEAKRPGTTSNDRGRVGSSPARSTKLYGIGRANLPSGLRAAQLGHVLIHWALTYGAPPENLVLLEVANEAALVDLLAAFDGLDVVSFREPDLDNELTAIAVDGRARKLLSSVPLALRPCRAAHVRE